MFGAHGAKIVVLDGGLTIQQLKSSISTEDMISFPDEYSFLFYDGPAESVADIELRDIDGVLTACTREKDLSQAKLEAWERVKLMRNARANGGVRVLIGNQEYGFDSDSESRQNVLGAALAANIPAIAATRFPMDWTLIDNTTLSVTAEQIIHISGEVVKFVDACHARARDFRTLIENADETTLQTIDITSGWPT